MSLPVPFAGDRGVYTWGAAVAVRLNRELLLELVADEATNSGSGSASDITGLTFPVENGKVYRIDLRLYWECDNTNQGPGVGLRHPGGEAQGLFRGFGITAGTTEDIARVIENSANTDEMTTWATTSTADTIFHIEANIRYECTADGTFAFRKQRNGTSGGFGVRIHRGSGGVVYLPA